MISIGIYADEYGTEPIGPLTDWPRRLYIKNEGDATLYKATIDLEGEVKVMIQMARDEEGEPGVWAAPGMGIIPLTKPVQPGKTFPFWVRTIDNPPRTLPFSFKVELTGAKPQRFLHFSDTISLCPLTDEFLCLSQVQFLVGICARMPQELGMICVTTLVTVTVFGLDHWVVNRLTAPMLSKFIGAIIGVIWANVVTPRSLALLTTDGELQLMLLTRQWCIILDSMVLALDGERQRL